MMAFDYAQNGEPGNGVGLHYSTFRPLPSKPPLQIKDLLREDFQTGGRIREVGLGQRRVSPHVFRHTTAMHLLQAGVDITAIALWLGHESPLTTHKYIEADLEMKKKTLLRLKEPKTKPATFQPKDALLAFLEAV